MMMHAFREIRSLILAVLIDCSWQAKYTIRPLETVPVLLTFNPHLTSVVVSVTMDVSSSTLCHDGTRRLTSWKNTNHTVTAGKNQCPHLQTLQVGSADISCRNVLLIRQAVNI